MRKAAYSLYLYLIHSVTWQEIFHHDNQVPFPRFPWLQVIQEEKNIIRFADVVFLFPLFNLVSRGIKISQVVSLSCESKEVTDETSMAKPEHHDKTYR